MNSDNYQFEKGLILCGDPDTGKSLIANFVKSLLPDQVLELNGREKNLFQNTFLLSGLTANHKAIFFDDVLSINTIEATYPLLHQEKIIVHRQGEPSIEMKCPRIIITTTLSFGSMIKIPTLFRRYHIVEIKGCGYSDGIEK